MRRHNSSLLLILLSLQLSPAVLTGSETALEPDQFLQMMAQMTERVEQRRADHGLVGHYNSALCTTTYEEVCTTSYTQECHNQVNPPPRQPGSHFKPCHCRRCPVFLAIERSVPLVGRNTVRMSMRACVGQRRNMCVMWSTRRSVPLSTRLLPRSVLPSVPSFSTRNAPHSTNQFVRKERLEILLLGISLVFLLSPLPPPPSVV